MPEIKPAYWALIPASVRYDRDLPANAKLLYGEITALSNRKGYCHAQNAYFCELFGLSERSITRLLSDLAKGGYVRIDVIRSAENEVIERRIYPVYDTAALPDPPDKNDRTPPDKNNGTPPDKNVGENNTRIEYIPPIVPQEGDGAPKKKKRRLNYKPEPDWKPERFAKFWEFYPRGENKQAAIRAWDKLRAEDSLIDTMAAALVRQKKRGDWKQGVGIPYASTWLNGRRWEDEERGPDTAQPEAPQPRKYHMAVIDGEEVVVYDD